VPQSKATAPGQRLPAALPHLQEACQRQHLRGAGASPWQISYAYPQPQLWQWCV